MSSIRVRPRSGLFERVADNIALGLRYEYVLDREDTIEVWLEKHIAAADSATYSLRANTIEFLGTRHENDFEIDSYEELLKTERATISSSRFWRIVLTPTHPMTDAST